MSKAELLQIALYIFLIPIGAVCFADVPWLIALQSAFAGFMIREILTRTASERKK